jgi:hypothetical protein
MELIDRYLRSIQFWLPADQKQDIIAELSEDIRSEVEEKEAELGHRLSDDELCALLKRRGNPLVVAERYLPKRYLIGPLLFPVYSMLVRSLVFYFLLPWAIFWLCFTAAMPSFYAEHPGFALFQTLAPMWGFGLNVIAGMTIVFAIVERVIARTEFGENPRARAVVKTRDMNRISRSTSIAEVVWNGFVLLWWSDALRPPTSPNMSIKTSAAIAQYFYWPVLFLLMATVIVAAANLVWPVWTKSRAAVRLVVDAAGLAIIIAMLAMWAGGGTFVDLHSAQLPPAAIANAQQWISVSCVITLLAVAASFAARSAQDMRRALGKEPSHNRAVKLLVGE